MSATPMQMLTIARNRVDELTEENRQLREQVKQATTVMVEFPNEWNLSNRRHRLLAVLYKARGKWVTTDALLKAAWPLAWTVRDTANVNIGIYDLRQRVRPFGVEIVGKQYFGYRLTDEALAIIDGALHGRS